MVLLVRVLRFKQKRRKGSFIYTATSFPSRIELLADPMIVYVLGFMQRIILVFFDF